MQCQGLNSVVEPGFWSVFAKEKLERFKLSDAAVVVNGWYGPARAPGVPPQLRVGGEDLLASTSGESGSLAGKNSRLFFRASGCLVNTNTVEDFKSFDKRAFLEQQGEAVRAAITDGSADNDPSLLARFAVLSYADLKKHRFLYWFCFPAIVDARVSGCKPLAIGEVGVMDWSHLGAIVAGSSQGEVNIKTKIGAFFGVLDGGSEIVNLATVAQLPSKRGLSRLTCLAMIDPGNRDDIAGWTAHNLVHWAIERGLAPKGTLNILCLRMQREQDVAFQVTLNECVPSSKTPFQYLGWEPNPKGQMGPRMVDLSAQLDPEKLAHAACDLNLKLMRWRALPELDTTLLAKTRCLLVGSGTLGCAVARSLLGWGFRHVTFLDNGKVSYSNPVRQSLFGFNDCKDGGAPKAAAAAAALERILPGVVTQGVQLNIPMPGHFCTSPAQVEQAQADAEKLEELIQNHDVVALLTDTRESRWLPTMLAAKYDKIVLNSALGFDSFVVMRHGCGPSSQVAHADQAKSSTERLGCYFCNDVVAPQNSMKDRTLDQQCTVTRPGLAPIAGALLVELLVGILHHPQGNRAPVVDEEVLIELQRRRAESAELEGDALLDKLGQLPHQVRGSLPSFQNMCVSGSAFPQCTACSARIVQAYDDRGFDMLLEAFNSPTFLEDLTGLTALRNSAAVDALLLDDFNDSDDDF